MAPRAAEKSARRARPFTSKDIQSFALGYEVDEKASSVQIAWLLENIALDRGWPLGETLGSEGDLVEQFGSGRDVIRGAIRILEARGLMRMQRGCQGGLRLLRPDIDHAAGTFATYLRASGYAASQIQMVNDVIKPLFSEFPSGKVVWQLWERVGAFLGEVSPSIEKEGARAEMVAMRLVKAAGTPIHEDGVILGREADICEAYGLGHRTFGQTLRILDDLGMLRVKRGRGGGYLLKRPSAIGVIRRSFAFLASRNLGAEAAEQVIWALSIANLRLVGQRLERLDEDSRVRFFRELVGTVQPLSNMRRWVAFQQGLRMFVDDLLLSTMISSMHAYLARVGPLPGFDQFDPRLANVEQAMLQALRDGRATEAEQHLRTGQGYMSKIAARA